MPSSFSTTSVEDIVYKQTLSAFDGVASDYFGGTVAISGNGKTLAVGSYLDSTAPYSSAGSVYIYTRITPGDNWMYQTKVLASDIATGTSTTGGFFGRSVALSYDGTVLAVGSANGTSYPGAVYVFTGSDSSWTQNQKLTTASAHNFGHEVAISGDGSTIVSRGLTVANSNVYIYTKPSTTWTVQQNISITGESGVNNMSLSHNGNILVFGGDDTGYIYTRSAGTWSQTKAYTDGNLNGMGQSCAVSADGTIVIFGQPYNDRAYIAKYSGSAWPAAFANLTVITPPSGHTALDEFGVSAAISSEGSTLYIGARLYPSNAGPGCVYVYTYNGTSATFSQRVLASDLGLTGSTKEFAASPKSLRVSANGTTFVVGAGGGGTYLGNVYTYLTGRKLDNNYYSYNGVYGLWNVSSFEALNYSTTSIYTSTGTFVIPAGAKVMEVTCIGGGSGGGSGARNNTASATHGGGGGGAGGSVSRYFFRVEDVGGAGSSVTITIGAGGVGGVQTATGTTALAGNSSGAGGTTSFGPYLYAGGGGYNIYGEGGSITIASASGGSQNHLYMFGGNPGIYSGATSNIYVSRGPGGGGCGLGGTSTFRTGGLSVVNNLTAATAGAAGPTDTTYAVGGGGGSGGASSTTVGGAGGAGGAPGGGGGGGGEGSTAGASGAGGAGGAGAKGSVKITVWYG